MLYVLFVEIKNKTYYKLKKSGFIVGKMIMIAFRYLASLCASSWSAIYFMSQNSHYFNMFSDCDIECYLEV